ncbi:MAG: TonB-dependent receptor [Alphaproteobacteria bacterium]
MKEGYVEASIPLLKDAPFAKNLTIDGARRWTNYSTSGDANTWKAGAVYEPDDQILVRVTQSSDIRAPTAAELNPNVSRFQSPIPISSEPTGITTTNAFLVSGGNPNLKNEEAVTKTAGLVLKPHFIPGFRFSGDYYNIKVAGAIDSIPAGTSTNNCKSQNLLCDLITFEGAFKASPLFEIRQNQQNLNKLHAEGAEIRLQLHVRRAGRQFRCDVERQLRDRLVEHERSGCENALRQSDGQRHLGDERHRRAVLQAGWRRYLHAQQLGRSRCTRGIFPEAKLESAWVGPEDYGYNINLSNSVQTNRVKSAPISTWRPPTRPS